MLDVLGEETFFEEVGFKENFKGRERCYNFDILRIYFHHWGTTTKESLIKDCLSVIAWQVQCLLEELSGHKKDKCVRLVLTFGLGSTGSRSVVVQLSFHSDFRSHQCVSEAGSCLLNWILEIMDLKATELANVRYNQPRIN